MKLTNRTFTITLNEIEVHTLDIALDTIKECFDNDGMNIFTDEEVKRAYRETTTDLSKTIKDLIK